jgi:hypothetical protein
VGTTPSSAGLAAEEAIGMNASDPVAAAVTRFRMDLETARAALTRAHQRHRDLADGDLSREQLATFIGGHEVTVIVAEINALGQAIAQRLAS